MVNYIENKVTPEDACTDLGFCRSFTQLSKQNDLNLDQLMKISIIINEIFIGITDRIHANGNRNIDLNSCLNSNFSPSLVYFLFILFYFIYFFLLFYLFFNSYFFKKHLLILFFIPN